MYQLQDIKKYKDSDSLMLESIKKMFGAADDSGILRMGMLKDGTIINWVKISASQNQIFYLAESALAMDRINQNIDCKDWNFSQLAEKLNTYYKENWFGIMHFLKNWMLIIFRISMLKHQFLFLQIYVIII